VPYDRVTQPGHLHVDIGSPIGEQIADPMQVIQQRAAGMPQLTSPSRAQEDVDPWPIGLASNVRVHVTSDTRGVTTQANSGR
jgi:hypothetical protein